MSVQLTGSDGKLYEFPDASAPAALASGQFRAQSALPGSTSPEQPGLPDAPLSDPGSATGPGLSKLVQTPDTPEPGQTGPGSGDASVSIAKDPSNTVNLKDSRTGADVAVPESQADQLVASGSHLATDIPLKGSDGKLYAIPDENIPAALRSGQFTLSTLADRQEQRGDQAVSEEVERSGLTGLKPYIGGTADAVLGFAGKHSPAYQIAAEAQNRTDPEFQRAGEQAFQQVDAEHPIASDVGAVAGEGLGAVAMGGIGAGAAEGLGLKGLAKVGLEGAVYSAEPVAKSLINRDPVGAAENLAIGIGINYGLHGIISGIGALPGLASRAADGIESLTDRATVAAKNQIQKSVGDVSQQEAENFVGKELGMTPKQIAENREAIQPALKAAGIEAGDTSEEVIRKMQKLETSGKAIGKAIEQLDTVEGKGTMIEDSMADAAKQLREQLLPSIVEREGADAAVKEYLSTLSGESREAAEENLQREFEEKFGKKLSPSEMQQLNAVRPLIEEVEAAGRRGTFADTQKLKKFVAEQTNFGGDNSYTNGLRKRAYGIVNEAIQRAEDTAAEQMGTPDVIRGLQESRAAYKFFRIFGDGVDRMEARVQPDTHGPFQPFHLMRHSLPIMIAHMAGLPAPLALAGGAALGMAKKYAATATRSASFAKLLGTSVQPATEAVLHATQTQTDLISEGTRRLLSSLGSTVQAGAVKAVDYSGIVKQFLPEEGRDRTHAGQLRQLQRMVQDTARDPEILTQRLAKVSEPLSREGLPEVAQAYTEHQIRLMKVLQAILPADPTMKTPHPFQATVQPDEISESTRHQFQRALTIAADPTHLLDLVRSNSITQADVAIAAATNPATLQKMRNALVEEGLKRKPDTTYQQRLSLGILMGTNLDESTDTVPVLQAGFASPGSGSGPGPKPHGRASASAQSELVGAYRTTSQTAAGH